MTGQNKNQNKKTIMDITNWENQRVLVRVDFNVPLDNDGQITDDTRIQEALPTLKHLIQQKARIILMSHMGRPKGAVKEEFRLTPVAKRLQELLPNTPITALKEIFSASVEETVDNSKAGEVILLENMRFEAGESKNCPELAKNLASLADIYVNDAFGTAHRAHASTEGVAHHVPIKVAGLLMKREIKALSQIVDNPAHPFTAIIGGSKVSSKITVLESLLDSVDQLIIGGAMLFSFLKAQGYQVGSSMVEDDYLDTAKNLLTLAKEKNTAIELPHQIVIADSFSETANIKTIAIEDGIPEGWMGLDIGPDSMAKVQSIIKASKTILWNGPMGVFEMKPFASGTQAIADTVAESTEAGQCQSILGGGDTVAAIEQFSIEKSKYTHVSTGGGASLEFLEGKALPGIAILDESVATAV